MSKRQFSYWCPGALTGKILASSPFEAAKLILKGEVMCCGGTRYSQPWRYIKVKFRKGDGPVECKIWEELSSESA